MEDDRRIIVADCGSGTTFAGWAGDDSPRIRISSVLGRVSKDRACELSGNGSGQTFWAGDDAVNVRGLLEITYPIERGIVKNWDDMALLWGHIFDQELRASPKEHPLFLSEPPMGHKSMREKMTEMMFETFEVPKLSFAPEPLLVIHGSGISSGVVVDIGDGMTTITPFYEGQLLSHAASRLELAGRDLTHYMNRLLSERGYRYQNSNDFFTVQKIKERLCYVASNFDDEMQRSTMSNDIEMSYTQIDGQIVTIGNERFRCPESLFQPCMVGLESPGIHQLIYNSVLACPIDTRKDMFKSIILVGGSTFFRGLAERLQAEISNLAPSSVEVKVISLDYRRYLTWTGGSILAELESHQPSWLSRQAYLEHGPSIIHSKCLHF